MAATRAPALARAALRPRPAASPAPRRRLHASPPTALDAPAAESARMPYASAVEYCRSQIHAKDHEHYLVSLFTPAPLRPTYWALRAFNAELASVREAVREDTLGKMRFQFWRETLDAVHAMTQGKVPAEGRGRAAMLDHPVAIALAAGVQNHGLSVHRLKRIVAAREANFLTAQYASVDALEEYAEGTASSLMYLHLELLGVKSLPVDHLASHIGKALGIATALRGTPHLARDRRFYLPADVCAKHGVVAEQVMRQGPSEPLAAAVFELATRANDHLITARAHVKEDGLETEAVPALLPAIAIQRWLRALEKVDFNLFDSRVHVRDGPLAAHLWWGNFRKQF